MFKPATIKVSNKDPPVSKEVIKVSLNLTNVFNNYNLHKGVPMKIINIINKMYTVLSPMPVFDSYEGGLYVVWYRADKVRDGFQYGKLIKGYNDMTTEDKRLTEDCVNELFTSDEVKALRNFVETELEKELFVEAKINLTQPIWEQDYYGPYSDSNTNGTIFLNMVENYNLPFEVRGHFNPAEGDPIIKHWAADKFMKPVKIC